MRINPITNCSQENHHLNNKNFQGVYLEPKFKTDISRAITRTTDIPLMKSALKGFLNLVNYLKNFEQTFPDINICFGFSHNERTNRSVVKIFPYYIDKNDNIFGNGEILYIKSKGVNQDNIVDTLSFFSNRKFEDTNLKTIIDEYQTREMHIRKLPKIGSGYINLDRTPQIEKFIQAPSSENFADWVEQIPEIPKIKNSTENPQ